MKGIMQFRGEQARSAGTRRSRRRSSLSAWLKGMLAILLVVVSTGATSLRAVAGGSNTLQPDFAAIDAYVEAQMRETGIPGLALGIVQGDHIVRLKGFGIADPSGRPVTAQTPFIIGSLNKPLTCLAVMQLVEAGKVDLDAPVRRYIPWFRVADEAASSRITVRHLMLQTSGLPTTAGYGGVGSSDTSDQALEQRVRTLAGVQLAHPVGTTFEYSNMSFPTLAVLIQQVSGQTYETYMQEHVFTPLQMQQSSASQPEAIASGLAAGYRFWFGVPVPVEIPWDRGQPMLYSSVEDLSHYLIAHLNGGRYGNASVVSAPGIDELLKPVTREGTTDAMWGMGWALRTDKSRFAVPALYKNGDQANYHADLVMLPDSRWGVVLLTNGQPILRTVFGDRPATAIASGVGNMLVGQQAPIFTSPIPLMFYAALLLLVTVQTALLIRGIFRLRRWYTRPETRPHGTRGLLWHVGLPFVLNLGSAAVMLTVVPGLLGAPLSFLMYQIPDLGYTLAVSGVIALVWGVTRAILAVLILRRPSPSAQLAVTAPANA